MYIVLIHNNINTRVFTPYSTMIKTRKALGSSNSFNPNGFYTASPLPFVPFHAHMPYLPHIPPCLCLLVIYIVKGSQLKPKEVHKGITLAVSLLDIVKGSQLKPKEVHKGITLAVSLLDIVKGSQLKPKEVHKGFTLAVLH